MATINIDVNARNNAERTLGTLRRQINNLNTQLATNRQAVLNADAAERRNIETKNREIRATQGLLRAKQEAARIRISEARAAERATRDIERDNQRRANQEARALQQYRQRLRRQFTDLQRHNRAFLRDAERVSRQYVRDWERAQRDAERATAQRVRRERAAVRSILNAYNRLFSRISRGVGLGLLFGGGFGVGAATRGILDAAVQIDTARNSLIAFTGNVEEANRRLARLRQLARLPGISFEGASRAAVQLEGVGLAAERAEMFIQGIGNALALVGRSDLSPAVRALSQIISRGEVLQEEINQLVEATPIASRALTQEFGTTLAENIRGQLTRGVDEFVTRLTSALNRLPQANQLGAANVFQNFRIALRDLAAEIGQLALPRLTQQISDLTNTIRTNSGEIVQRFEGAVDLVIGAIDRLINNFRNLSLFLRTGLVALALTRVTSLFLGMAQSMSAAGAATTVVSSSVGGLSRFFATATPIALNLSRVLTIVTGAGAALAGVIAGIQIIRFIRRVKSADTSIRDFTGALRENNAELEKQRENLEAIADISNSNALQRLVELNRTRPDLESRAVLERLIAGDTRTNLERQLQELVDQGFSGRTGQGRRRRAEELRRQLVPIQVSDFQLIRDARAQLESLGRQIDAVERRPGRAGERGRRIIRQLTEEYNALSSAVRRYEANLREAAELETRIRTAQSRRGDQATTPFTPLVRPRGAPEQNILPPFERVEQQARGLARYRDIFRDFAQVYGAFAEAERRRANQAPGRAQPGLAEQIIAEETVQEARGAFSRFTNFFTEGNANIVNSFRQTARDVSDAVDTVTNRFTDAVRVAMITTPDLSNLEGRIGDPGARQQEIDEQIRQELQGAQTLETIRAESIRSGRRFINATFLNQRRTGIQNTISQFLTDIASIPSRLSDISADRILRLESVEDSLQSTIDRINRDADLSARQRQERIIEAEERAAERRIQIERTVNREKTQAYNAFTRNALLNVAELIRAEVQAAVVRATTARITSALSSAILPTIGALGSGGTIGLGLAAILALQLGASALNNRLFHFADTDRIAALAGRESATRVAADRVTRENARDFSREFGNNFAGTISEALAQNGSGAPVIQVNAVDIDSDEGIANRYVRLQDLIEQGFVVVRGT